MAIFKIGTRTVTEQEYNEWYASIPVVETESKTVEEQIAELRAQNEMLTECLLELSELLYN